MTVLLAYVLVSFADVSVPKPAPPLLVCARRTSAGTSFAFAPKFARTAGAEQVLYSDAVLLCPKRSGSSCVGVSRFSFPDDTPRAEVVVADNEVSGPSTAVTGTTWHEIDPRWAHPHRLDGPLNEPCVCRLCVCSCEQSRGGCGRSAAAAWAARWRRRWQTVS